jgi:hypothetical protein
VCRSVDNNKNALCGVEDEKTQQLCVVCARDFIREYNAKESVRVEETTFFSFFKNKTTILLLFQFLYPSI